MAAVDFFLKIDGIEGESPDAKHKNEIHLDSWSWGESNAGSMAHGGGGGAGKVSMQDIHFTTMLGKQGPKLALACADGSHIKKAVLTARKAGKDQQEYYVVTMTDLLVSSYQISGHGGAEILPIENCSLNFGKIEWEYKEQKIDGSLGGAVKAGYDLKLNKKV